jgi:hypothetical protein
LDIDEAEESVDLLLGCGCDFTDMLSAEVTLFFFCGWLELNFEASILEEVHCGEYQ